MDTLSTAERSRRMSLVKGKDTRPELTVRRLVHGMGYRYRLHDKRLPGKPDLVFGPRRKVIFVHGCFWHQHPEPSCKLARMPKSRQEFWGPKLHANRDRDVRDLDRLQADGWACLVIWECEVAATKMGDLERRIRKFLGASGRSKQ